MADNFDYIKYIQAHKIGPYAKAVVLTENEQAEEEAKNLMINGDEDGAYDMLTVQYDYTPQAANAAIDKIANELSSDQAPYDPADDETTGFNSASGPIDEAYLPSNIKEFAKRKGVSSLVSKVAKWAEKAGKSITGGTAIGKNYSTLVLDLKHQGGEIRINTEDETMEVNGEEVGDYSSFVKALEGSTDDLNESPQAERAEEIARSLRDNYGMDEEGIQIYLEDDMGLSGAVANAIVDRLFADTGAEDDDDKYNDLRADDQRMNQLDEMNFTKKQQRRG